MFSIGRTGDDGKFLNLICKIRGFCHQIGNLLQDFISLAKAAIERINFVLTQERTFDFRSAKIGRTCIQQRTAGRRPLWNRATKVSRE